MLTDVKVRITNVIGINSTQRVTLETGLIQRRI